MTYDELYWFSVSRRDKQPLGMEDILLTCCSHCLRPITEHVEDACLFTPWTKFRAFPKKALEIFSYIKTPMIGAEHTKLKDIWDSEIPT